MNRENYSGTKEEQELIDYLNALRSKPFHPLHVIDLFHLGINYFLMMEKETPRIREIISSLICRKQSATDGLEQLEKDNLIQEQANMIAKLEKVIEQNEYLKTSCRPVEDIIAGSEGRADGS